ncbi:PR5-like receptor kinase isoform X2 [Tasmannia lanceolata]|uniref:PR5-like receptor kinase isoform X2 n=1 Tax=Tasmannia lanceolata TaxID=3420 RepID=UPI0040644AF9
MPELIRVCVLAKICAPEGGTVTEGVGPSSAPMPSQPPSSGGTGDTLPPKPLEGDGPSSGPTPFNPPSSGGTDADRAGRGKNTITIIGVTTGVGSILLVCILFSLFCRRKLSVYNLIFFCKKKTNNTKKVDVFLRDYGSSLGPRRYTYSDIKKITSSFKDKVGQGGYGSVFKGKLRDGRLVAVKVLSESKGNGEEFINEVASISRTSHVNVVSLLGFCSQGLKRALIYEFMPNGSLDKFIYAEKPRNADPLGWEKLYQITVGIAQGLEYLHRGCNTRILHLDIKPHNILLDQDFCPKISDFGLAKLCPTKDSTVSLVGARGTFGYTAPEIGCRNIGGVSTKSDVYSYGMMVLEIVGGRKNIDAGVDNTSEIYFPHLIYKRMDLNGDLGLDGVTAEEEKIARKMILVSLWCIQTNPTNRPSMNMVVEMLEGSLEDLQMPPNPILSSPNPTNQHSINMVVEMLEGSLEDLQMPPNPILSSPTRLSQEAATMSMIVRDGSPQMSHGSSQLGEIALIHSSLH